MIRSPIAAGRFYPGSAPALRTMIEGFVDRHASRAKAIGIVSPHAGYIYSGSVAGTTISQVALTDTVVIMGPNHTGLGAPFSITTRGAWETPFGLVNIDSGLAEQILNHSAHLEEDTAAHRQEHSIEVQLPFLQYFRDDISIVPIVLAHGPGEVYKEIGSSIARAISQTGIDALIMASTDMTHYETHEEARRKDAQAIDAILALDEDQLLERIQTLHISMCGYGPTMSLISAAKVLGATKAELIRYQTSGETSGDYGRVVGYAGVIIR